MPPDILAREEDVPLGRAECGSMRAARRGVERLVPTIVLGGGLTGFLAGYGLEYWSQVIEYPMNIGGRPFHSWVSFIPPAFETTILFAAFGAVFGMLALNGFPRPYHPVFNIEEFAKNASNDRFYLVVEAADPQFDAAKTADLLKSLNPTFVKEIPA